MLTTKTTRKQYKTILKELKKIRQSQEYNDIQAILAGTLKRRCTMPYIDDIEFQFEQLVATLQLALATKKGRRYG